MRIENMTINNFRGHKHFSADLDKLNFVVGLNATGKSSIALAVEYALTGRAFGVTDERGANAESLIHIGERELEIILTVARGEQSGIIQRTKSQRAHELSLNMHVAPLPEAQRRLYEVLDVTGDTLSACLNSSRFLQMTEKEQKSLLTQVLATQTFKVPREILDAAKSLDRACTVWTGELESVSQVDKAYKDFYEARTETNRDIKALGYMEEPAEAEEGEDYAAARKQMEDLRQQLTLLERSKARAEENYEVTVRSNKRTREIIDHRKRENNSRVLSDAEVKALESRLDDAPKAKNLSESIRKLADQLNEKRREFDDTKRTDIVAATGDVKAAQTLVDRAEEVFANLRAIKADCPTCSRPLKAADKKAITESLKSALESRTAERDEAEAKLAEARDREYPEEIDQLHIDLDAKMRQLEAMGDLTEAESKLRVHRTALVEVGRCEREIAALKDPDKPDTRPDETRIKELNERISKGDEVITALVQAEQKRDEYRRWTERRKSLEARVQALNHLIDYFGPNGVKTLMVGDKAMPFAAAMNQVLGKFGYAMEFTLEPYSFRVGAFDRHGWRTLRQLSESESFRFGVAFQIALAKATGIDFVIIDRADVLDPDSRNALFGMLTESGLEQAIVLATSDQGAPQETPDGVKFIELREQVAVAAQ